MNMISQIMQSTHIFLIAMLISFWKFSGVAPPGAFFTLVFYFDIIDALVSFKRCQEYENDGIFISWRILGYNWLIFKVLLPIYGIYRNGFGWILSPFIFCIIVSIQLILWLFLPHDKTSRPLTSSRGSFRGNFGE